MILFEILPLEKCKEGSLQKILRRADSLPFSNDATMHEECDALE